MSNQQESAPTAPPLPESSSMSEPKSSQAVKKMKKHTTTVQLDIANKTSLSDLSKRFAPPAPPPEAPTPSKKSTYFEKLDIAVRMELDHGTQHIIDVQPDLRFPFQYFTYIITEQYPDLTVKSHPYTSTFTLVAYNQLLFNAYLLLCDLYSRDVPSRFANHFKSDPTKADLLTKLLNCNVPVDLEPLLNAFAPTYDPQRKLQLFVPTLAGFDFRLDFGRLIPPSLMILAHQILASVRSNADPEAILRQFYSTTILTVAGEDYTPSHFLGGYYNVANRCTSHPNWVNSRFEKMFNPVIGRALSQRPTLAKARFVVPEFANLDAVDPYELLLCYSPDNIEKLLEILTDVSSFYKESSAATKSLGQVLDASSGIAILYHSIWSTTLPTCHHLQVPPPGDDQPDVKTDTQFATYVKFLVPGPTFKSELTPPSADIDSVFYLVGTKPYDPAHEPFPYDTFDKTKHVYPDVLWFQPYSKNPSALNYALTLGLIIETGDIDAVTIPTPNISLSLTENNSMYFQGLMPLGHVQKFIPSTAQNGRLRICKRQANGDDDQPVGIAFRDSSTVAVPRFGTEHVRANMNQLYGVTIKENCNDNETDFTYAAWKASEAPPLPADYTYMWSSYRFVRHANTRRRRVSLYYTLRQFYGENVTLSRTRNPVLLLP